MSQPTVSKISAALLFGAPGVGKGTQGRILSAVPGFHHLASGDMFRGLAPDSEEGIEAAAYSNKGELVPDDLTIRIFKRALNERIDSARFRPNEELLILDGIPRTVHQAECLQQVVDVLAVVCFGYSDENAMVERLKSRAVLENRRDDADEKTIRHRFNVYRSETQPVLSSYPAEIVKTIDALRTPVVVLRDVLDCLIPVWPANGTAE